MVDKTSKFRAGKYAMFETFECLDAVWFSLTFQEIGTSETLLYNDCSNLFHSFPSFISIGVSSLKLA